MLRRMERALVELDLAFHALTAADRVLAEDHAVLGWLDSAHCQVELLWCPARNDRPLRSMSGTPT